MSDLLDDLGDINLDDAFPNPELSSAPVSSQVVATPAPQQTVDEPFLKTATGSVYKSAEDAVKGIEHKDALIQKLRQEAIDRSGVDPVTGQPVVKATEPVNYTQNSDRFLNDLADAAKKGDTSAYAKVQEKFVQDVMAPYAPVINQFARSQAVDTVSNEITDFRQFLNSEDKNAVLNENPVLRDALNFAEANPQNGGQLAELYKIAYKLNTARRLPEAMRAAQTVTHQARPTVSSTSTVPPPSSGVRHEAPSYDSSEGRKALIEAQERAGVLDLRF